MIDSYPDACFVDNFLRVMTERYIGWDLEEVAMRRQIASDDGISLSQRRMFVSFRTSVSVVFLSSANFIPDNPRHVLYLSRRSSA
jgi:hypothetical protein